MEVPLAHIPATLNAVVRFVVLLFERKRKRARDFRGCISYGVLLVAHGPSIEMQFTPALCEYNLDMLWLHGGLLFVLFWKDRRPRRGFVKVLFYENEFRCGGMKSFQHCIRDLLFSLVC